MEFLYLDNSLVGLPDVLQTAQMDRNSALYMELFQAMKIRYLENPDPHDKSNNLR